MVFFFPWITWTGKGKSSTSTNQRLAQVDNPSWNMEMDTKIMQQHYGKKTYCKMIMDKIHGFFQLCLQRCRKKSSQGHPSGAVRWRETLQFSAGSAEKSTTKKRFLVDFVSWTSHRNPRLFGFNMFWTVFSSFCFDSSSIILHQFGMLFLYFLCISGARCKPEILGRHHSIRNGFNDVLCFIIYVVCDKTSYFIIFVFFAVSTGWGARTPGDLRLPCRPCLCNALCWMKSKIWWTLGAGKIWRFLILSDLTYLRIH